MERARPHGSVRRFDRTGFSASTYYFLYFTLGVSVKRRLYHGFFASPRFVALSDIFLLVPSLANMAYIPTPEVLCADWRTRSRLFKGR